jgi:Mg-chelatase subunit ChlD
MKADYTHISIILDRTGSMENIRDDTIGGFNTFLKDQKSQADIATLTLVQFDTYDPYEVIHKFESIQEIPELTRETFVPRAGTPLLDAIGRGINDLEQSLSQMKESQRPLKVVFLIITDGQENSSREFRKEQIAKMIQQKQEQDKWQFVFLSADLNAINDAQEYGISRKSSMAFDKNVVGTASAWLSSSERISDYRKSADLRDIEFTKEDRAKQATEQKRKKPKS